MKKLLLMLSVFGLLLSSCIQDKTQTVKTEVQQSLKHIQYKYVINTIQTSETKQITHYETQDDRVSHTAGGAIIGGIGAHLLGFKASHGAIAGGLLGAATSSSPTTSSWVESVVIYHCTTYFNDNSTIRYEGTCPYVIGDSIPIN